MIHSMAHRAGAGSVPERLGWDCREARHQGRHRHNTVRAQAAFTQGKKRKVDFLDTMKEQKGLFSLNKLVGFYWWKNSSGHNAHIFYVKKPWIFLRVQVRIIQGV